MTELYIIEAKDSGRKWNGCVSKLADIAPTLARHGLTLKYKARISRWQRDTLAQNTYHHTICNPNWRGGPLGGWRLIERFTWPCAS